MQQWSVVLGSGLNQVDKSSMEEVFLPLTPEILVPRLGEYLVENQYITSEELASALEKQQSIRARNQTAPLLGQVMVAMGIITQEALDHAITELILQFRHALETTNHALEQRVEERTAQLKDAVEKLAEANLEKTNFISNISHELRTPLTHIKGFLDLLDDTSHSPLNKEQHEIVDVIRKASGRLEKLIDDLILFSTAQKNGILLIYRDFSISDLAVQITSRFQAAAMQKQIRLTCDCDKSLPLVSADEGKINWVISQLLDNAIKFTSNGGKITLTARLEDHSVMVSVEDTGIGIPEDKLKEIFEPFHQLDGSTTRTYGGTGLGLSLVKRIIEAHNEILVVTSAPGHGSNFGFHLKTI